MTDSETLGLSMKFLKTYCMVIISKKKEIPKCQLIVNGQAMRQVKQFSYLGSILTSDGRCDTEVKRKDRSGKESFQISSRSFDKQKDQTRHKKRNIKV